MNNITKIQTVLDNAVIKQEFIGFIADVEFDNTELYYTIMSIFKELKKKFTNINRPTEFVTFLK